MARHAIQQDLSIPAFYAGRSILVTGATGYLGKALLEKLLRSCPDVEEVFVLIRPLDNTTVDKRLQQLLTNPLFDKLRSERPGCFAKLIPVKGDVVVEELGLSPQDRDTIIQKVSIIFHIAASVRFDDTLKNAVLTNVRATRDICILGKRMKNLVALVHVSSTYSHTDKSVVQETLYPPQTDWRKTIRVAEALDEDTLNAFTLKYVDAMPNLYTFTKRLAEQVISDYSELLPCLICRPSIVTPSLKEPMKGWLDNYNGPVGLLIGSGKGVLRVLYSNPATRDNYIPVDIVAKALTVMAWKRAMESVKSDTCISNPLVYNCSANCSTNVSRHMMTQIGINYLREYPFEGIIWKPTLIITNSPVFYCTLLLLLHIIPALLVDGLLRLSGRRPRLLKLQRKICLSNRVVSYFILNEWDFRNQKLLALSEEVPRDDQETFGFATNMNHDFDKLTYLKNCMIGSKVYLLGESMDRLDAAKVHYERLFWINRIVQMAIVLVSMYTLYGVVA